ncbi:MAG: DNA recombination protein RmuC, partial [Candidatus Poseidoniaceae archaeon]|nr:DNA recombination protein RmuC [Candidatus Poseidoniaceae archaeon]
MIEMMDLILILIATGIGFSFAWIIANNNKQTNGVDIPDMEGIFSKLSTEALNANNEQFLSLAEQVLKVQQAEGNQELEVKKAQIEGLLKPLSEQIKALENENKAMEIARGKAYVEIKEHVKLMLAQTENLGKETNSLTTALTQSANIRGNWGEISLENIFEM